MIPIPASLYVGVAVAAISFAGGWKVCNWKHAADREATERGAAQAIQAAAKELANIEVKNVTIRQTLEKEIHHNTVYVECKHTPNGLSSINAALTEPTGGSKLPKTGDTK